MLRTPYVQNDDIEAARDPNQNGGHALLLAAATGKIVNLKFLLGPSCVNLWDRVHLMNLLHAAIKFVDEDVLGETLKSRAMIHHFNAMTYQERKEFYQDIFEKCKVEDRLKAKCEFAFSLFPYAAFYLADQIKPFMTSR